MLDPDISTPDALAHLSALEDPAHALDRRRFLQLVGMGVGAGLVAGTGGSLLDHVLLDHDPSAWAAGPVAPTDGILVVIGMYGGNDGLNTVVPLNDGRYRDMHGSLAIPAGDTLRINSGTGLNPALTEFKRFWDAGQLAIVEGVGYPNPDLSHFNSMAYWMAGKPNAIPSTGWLGRWLDGYLGGSKDLFAATEIGHSVPLHLIGAHQRGTVVPPNRPGWGSDESARATRAYTAMRAMASGATAGWSGPVGQAFVDQIDLAQKLAPVIPEEGTLPDTEIVAQLEVAARLINANLGFRVLTAGYGDFDSHAGQPNQHRDRMTELNAALARFFQILDPAWLSRVTVMTFSEFGRTPWNNDGAGTDHGTSAPHFVVGQNVKGGLYGKRPSLAGLGRWDRMPHHVDFRSYYASIIDGWLGGGSSTVLGGSFENLRLFRRGPGIGTDGKVMGVPAPPSPKSYFTPIRPERIVDTRRGIGAPKAPIGAGKRLRVKVAGKGGVPKSGVTAVIANVTAVAPSQHMHFTVYPGGSARPGTSNLNVSPGQVAPNLVMIGVGADGYIEVFNSHGQTHCLVDVFGYARADSGARFSAVTPKRLFDSRRGSGVRKGVFRPGEAVKVQVAGKVGVPKSGATAVVMNLTAVAPDQSGHLRVTPTGRKAAETSNVNFRAGQTVPNLVICELGDGGKLTIDAAVASAHVVGDVFGYFASTGDRLIAMPPSRVLDTRKGIGAAQRKVGPSHRVDLTVAGSGGVPSGATAVVMNVTATNVSGASHVSVWPRGGGEPSTSNLNLERDDTRANLVICQVGDEGGISLASPVAECDLIADVLGYFIA